MNYTARQIAEITHSTFTGDGDLLVKNIAYDSRIIYSAVHTAFIALRTTKNDGEKYISAAIEKGIKVIISEHETEHPKDVTFILTPDTTAFLQQLAAYHVRRFPDLQTIGITGSNGKTIVKEWLYQTVSDDFVTVKSPKSFNSQIGLPVSLLGIAQHHQLGIFEAGISRPGEMEHLENIFHPKIGVLTHIGTAHLANFKDENQLIDEKLKLFRHSKVIIYNGDNEYVDKKIKTLYSDRKLISFGLKENNNVCITSNWQNRKEEILVRWFDEYFSFPAQQRDQATLANALCVIAVLKELGFENQQIINKINSLKAVEMRLESVEGIQNNLIINDSYNLDMDSLRIAYQFVQEYQKEHKVLILTDFVESVHTAEFYPEVAALTNEQHFDEVFLIGKEITDYQHLFTGNVHIFRTTEQLLDSNIFKHIHRALILLKGARKFETDRIKTALELRKNETTLEVNLNAILHNINFHKSLLKPETKMMAMVKANSYGLGSYEISEFLQHHHIDYLGVAFADEGAELRKKGITTPIIVMNPEQHSYDSVIEYNLEPEIYSLRVLNLFYDAVKKSGYDRPFPIHIKLETGMHRLGFKTWELDSLAETLKDKNLKVQSIFSHLSTADVAEEREYALHQLRVFEKNSSYLIRQLGYTPIRHILNSSGITKFTDYQYDMVRIGIGMLGESPFPEIQQQLRHCVSFKTVISQISEVAAGESVGYGRHFKTTKMTKIATVPVGYADGIHRIAGNGAANIGIGGVLVPVVGNICMDMMMVNIDAIPDAREGDSVIIFGDKPSLAEFADYCKTIPYEVLTSISKRVKRIYIKD